jgi:hypothetical protein
MDAGTLTKDSPRGKQERLAHGNKHGRSPEWRLLKTTFGVENRGWTLALFLDYRQHLPRKARRMDADNPATAGLSSAVLTWKVSASCVDFMTRSAPLVRQHRQPKPMK